MRKIGDLCYGRGKNNVYIKESFRLLFLSWSLTGIAPTKTPRLFNTIFMIICWCGILMCPYCFIAGAVNSMKTSVITVTLVNLQAALNGIALPLKAITIAVNVKRLRSIDNIFKELDNSYTDPVHHELIKKSVMRCTRLFVVFLTVYWLYGITSCTAALFSHKYPHSMQIPFIDWLPDSDVKYWLHYILEASYFFFLLLVNLTNDVFPAIYIKAIRTHLYLLTERVSTIGKKSETTAEQNYDTLVECIISHQKLLRISDTVGDVISKSIFFQLAVYSTILSICMLNMLIFADTTYILVTLVYLIPVLSQTIPSCYQASMLEAESTKLSVAIFHTNWWNLDKRCHKLLIYFIQRSQQEMVFTAVKLFQISLKTNLTIAKFSFTLYTFINKMGIGETWKN